MNRPFAVPVEYEGFEREPPPFAGLRLLEAACRSRSFTTAGVELGVSHSAVSQAITRLEGRYGVQLFRRVGSGVAPTEAALALASAYSAALREIDRGEATAVKYAETPAFVLSTVPSVASLWLAPRLEGLQRALAGTQLELRTSRELSDLQTDDVDLAIRFGLGDWPGAHSELLFHERAIAVASPAFLAGRSLLTPPEVAAAPLILEAPLLWGYWFEAAGLPPFRLTREAGPLLDDAALALNLARRGKGIALARWIHAVDLIASGELVKVSDIEVRTPFSCWAVWRNDHPHLRRIHAALEWLLDACAGSGLIED